MLIETDAHRRDAERAAVGVFALRLAHGVDRRGLEIEAAERGIVGVEDGLEALVDWAPQPAGPGRNCTRR